MATARAAGTADPARHWPVWIDAARSVVELVALLAVASIGLRVVDELPGKAVGVARGVRRVASVAALERQASHKMAIPAYFPDALMWPPSDLLIFGGTSVSMSFRHRRTSATWLIVAMAVGTTAVAPQVLPPATPLQTEGTSVRSHPATIERLRDLDGVIWYQLTWQMPGATRLVRYRGTLDQIMLIANSMDERGQ